MTNKRLIVIIGPTAVGKTSFCVQLAQHFGIEVVSADSRQFYKEMQIGTAKPTTDEMQGIPHHLVNHISIHDTYTVADYEQDALQCLHQLFQKTNTAILTGGSGLFIKAVCEGLDEMPNIKKGIREDLMEIHAKSGLDPLLEELAAKDPTYFNEVDQNNYVRVIRALEVIRSSGKSFSSFRTGKKAKRPFDIIKIGLTRDREELYQRINLRMDLMLSEGLVDEAQQLYKYKHLPALKTVGYQELFDYWDNKYDWEKTIDLLKQNSRRYAKRQFTWFKKDKNINWFHPSELTEVLQFLEKEHKA